MHQSEEAVASRGRPEVFLKETEKWSEHSVPSDGKRRDGE